MTPLRSTSRRKPAPALTLPRVGAFLFPTLPLDQPQRGNDQHGNGENGGGHGSLNDVGMRAFFYPFSVLQRDAIGMYRLA